MKDDCKAFQEQFLLKYSTSSSVEEMWLDLKSTLLKLQDKHVPSKMSSSRFNQPWINSRVRRLTRRKKRSFNKAKQSKRAKDFRRYQRLKKQCRSECKAAYNSFLTDIVSPDSKSNPKRFWRFISGKRCDASGVAPLKSREGIILSDSQSKAHILNSQFTSVFNQNEPTGNIKSIPTSHPPMNTFEITQEGVYKLLCGLDVYKSPGPDDLSPRLLKELAPEISPILTLLYQASLHHGKIPKDWKLAHVVPVFKSGDRGKAENYRPISLTSIACKILEHIISSNVMRHLDEHGILSDAQHGFRKKRSCESQLIIAVQDLAKGLDDKAQSDVIFLDLSKAFDKVPHTRLLHKLTHYGITGKTHHWIKDFLSNRSQRVVLEGSTSGLTNVTSGVPQGSVLGPLLFLAYVNDLPDYISPSTSVRLFADDCMIYRQIKHDDDTAILQNDLNSLQRWEEDWLMSFNPKKCQVLRVARKKNPIIFNYNIHNQILANQDSAKYLGVHLTKDLNWKTHIDTVVKKANSTSAFLQRNIGPCPRQTKVLCYKALIRPLTEYACTVWDPATQRDINRLEMIQRRYARFTFNDFQRTSSVSAMLQQLHWPTLQERRAQFKVIMIYRCLHNLVHIPLTHLEFTTTTSQRGHSQKLIIPFARTLAYQRSFFPDSIRLWNLLPEDAVSCTSEDHFRQRVQPLQLR